MSELNGHGTPANDSLNDPHGEAELSLRDRLNSETGVLKWEELTKSYETIKQALKPG